MDERRDPPPEPESGQPALIVGAGGGLSPVQQAWSDYVTHATNCPQCRSLDLGKCDDAERLYRAYGESGQRAYERLADEAP